MVKVFHIRYGNIVVQNNCTIRATNVSIPNPIPPRRMITWLHGYIVTWLHGYMITWLQVDYMIT